MHGSAFVAPTVMDQGTPMPITTSDYHTKLTLASSINENKQVLSQASFYTALNTLPSAPVILEKFTEAQLQEHRLGFPLTENEIVPRCPYNVPSKYELSGRFVPKHTGQTVDPTKKYKILYQEMVEGHITNAAINWAVKTHFDSAPLFSCYVGWDEIYIGRAQVRGDSRYAQKTKRKIEKASSGLEEIEGTAIFFTVTVDPKQFSNNIYAAWIAGKEEISKCLRKLKKLGELYYICIPEAQNSGLIHFHIIFKVKNLNIKYYIDKKGKYRIKNNALRLTIKDTWEIGLSDVQVVKDRAVSSYLAKYIAKGLSSSDFLKDTKNEKEEAELRKAMLSYMCPIITKCRQLRCSRNLSGLYTLVQKINLEEEIEVVNDLKEVEKMAINQPLALLTLMNNSTTRCQGSTYIITKKEIKKEFESKIDSYMSKSSESYEEFKNSAQCIGCPGCKISKWVKEQLETAKIAEKALEIEGV